MSVDWTSEASPALTGTVTLPGDKSISHRALLLAALADGRSRLDGVLESGDTHATAGILQQLGVPVERPAAGQRVIHGVGLHGLQAPSGELDCGNSATAMRLLAGVLAGQGFASTLTGDRSLLRRPMQRVSQPLVAMGARMTTAADGYPPVHIDGGARLTGMRHEPPMASAQVKSALLLAGLYAQTATEVHEPRLTRDHTERMLAACGVDIRVDNGRIRLQPPAHLQPVDVAVPADFSAAAFFLVAASIVPGSDLRLCGVNLNPRRTGLLRALQRMGADIEVENESRQAGEPVADLRVRHARLSGIELPPDWVPDMIDEFPALCVAAAVADGTTVISAAQELRVKESDRLAGMAAALATLGVAVAEKDDGLRISGGHLQGGTVDAQGDHRLAMALAVAGLVAATPVHIRDCANVATSFPDFSQQAAECGFRLRSDGDVGDIQ